MGVRDGVGTYVTAVLAGGVGDKNTDVIKDGEVGYPSLPYVWYGVVYIGVGVGDSGNSGDSVW